MSVSEKFRVGIIGLGHWGPNIVRSLSTDPRCEIRYVCDLLDSNIQRVESLIPIDCGRTVNANELIQSMDLDAVVVSTSASTHYSLVKEALLAKKHVFCEKPLTLDWKQDRELTNLAEQVERKLVVGYTFLFNDAIRNMREMVLNNSMGQLYYMTATRTQMGLVRKDTSVLWDLAPHDVAIMNYLLGDRPKRVSAVGGKPLGLEKHDVAFINLFYPEDVIGQIRVSWADSNKERIVRVIGSKAGVVFNDLDGLEPIRLFKKEINLDTQINPDFGEFKFLLRDGDIISPKFQQHEPLKTILESFVQVVLNDAENLVDGRFAQNISSVIMATQKSIENDGVPEEVEY